MVRKKIFALAALIVFGLAGCQMFKTFEVDSAAVFAGKSLDIVVATQGRHASGFGKGLAHYFKKNSTMSITSVKSIPIDGPFLAGETEYKLDETKADRKAIMQAVKRSSADYVGVIWVPVYYVVKNVERLQSGPVSVIYIHVLSFLMKIYDSKTGKEIAIVDAPKFMLSATEDGKYNKSGQVIGSGGGLSMGKL